MKQIRDGAMVTDEAVEAAARAAYEYRSEVGRNGTGTIVPVPWDSLPRSVRHMRRQVARVHLAAVGARDGGLMAELERVRAAARTLGKIIEDQCNDALAASGVVGVIGEDGDGDWGLVWEGLLELRPRAERAEGELARYEAFVDEVMKLAALAREASYGTLSADALERAYARHLGAA